MRLVENGLLFLTLLSLSLMLDARGARGSPAGFFVAALGAYLCIVTPIVFFHMIGYRGSSAFGGGAAPGAAR